MKPTRESVSLMVRGDEEGRLLAVRRPPDDEDLPDAWGLPAASLRPGESWREAAARIGPQKLGVELRVGEALRSGELEREAYLLRMRLYRAEIVAGRPSVPQEAAGVTQYAAWEWAPPRRLEPAARRGSLCSRLCLAWHEAGRDPAGGPRADGADRTPEDDETGRT